MSDNFLSNNPQDLARKLYEGNRAMQERETRQQAETLQLPYINARNFPVDLNALSLFTREEAENSQAAPFYKEGLDLRIGVLDPHNALLQEKLKQLTRYKVTLYLVSPDGLRDITKFYSKVLVPKNTASDVIKVKADLRVQETLAHLSDKAVQQHVSATELLADLVRWGLKLNASDIHVEPGEHVLKIRFRVDGVLQELLQLSQDLQKSITSRIKVVAKLKLNVSNVPQDGRITFFVGDKPVDVRISVLPSGYGESIVMRLLGVGTTNLKLDQLGLRGRAYDIIERDLAKPNGMIITTGPTGSGKTTTLYAFLSELNHPGVKIITLEDPIEYKLEGIQQTPIDYHVDFSFASGLRAILRQDPDIVMVGEIRDGETAETALQAALTGHIVLSTLHTNDSAGAVPRLLTMGVKPFTIAPAINAVIAQRLVRKLCSACKKPTELSPDLQKRVQAIVDQIPEGAKITLPKKLQFSTAPGCPACHGLGYQGRIGIYEVMEVNEAVKDLIIKEANSLDIKRQAVADGMVTMVQDGLLKALEGVTDVEEVFRVAGE